MATTRCRRCRRLLLRHALLLIISQMSKTLLIHVLLFLSFRTWHSQSFLDKNEGTPNRDLATNTSMRSRLQLLKISLVYFGIELLFSIEVALTLPLLLRLRVSESTYSYVYFVSPIVGFLLQPVLGVWSDRCTSPLGRRRPFILVLGIFSFIGISFILNGQAIGEWLGDGPTKVRGLQITLILLQLFLI